MDEVKKRICSKENKISNLKLSPIKINYIPLMEYGVILYFQFHVCSVSIICLLSIIIFSNTSNVHPINSMDLIYWLQSHGNERDKLNPKYIMRMTCINFYTFNR